MELAERLRTRGIEVWIDQNDIGAAASWSKEIVRAIDDCKAFVVLISSNSLASKNVAREVGVASEAGKPMLPVALEDIKLSDDLRYHLSGIQRVAYTQFDAIALALHGFGIETKKKANKNTLHERKSLMILPFEDLSPTGDNGWFADGLAAELISALSNVRALRVTDQQTTKEYKKYTGSLITYAKEMGIRYFIQGSVRKFVEQIKITTALLDIETGDHLWQGSMKGTMRDIFDIQEKVAEKVAEGLKIHLASDEKKKLAERGTENAEAYELELKALEYFARQTKDGLQLAAQLHSDAIRLDPGYARAYSGKAFAIANLYRQYTRDPALLEEGLSLIGEALRLKPDLWHAYNPLSVILILQGKLEEAERTAKEFVRNAQDDPTSHGALGFLYINIGQHSQSIGPYEAALKLKPDNLEALFNLVVACNGAKEWEKRKHWSDTAIPLYRKHLKLFPDDENMRVKCASLLYFAGRDEEAKDAVQRLGDLRDGGALYNTACLHCELGDYALGLRVFRKALDAGYRNVKRIKSFLSEKEVDDAELRGTSEYEEVKRIVEQLEKEANYQNA